MTTVLAFAVVTVLLYGLIVLAVVLNRRRHTRRPRWRAGQAWPYEPIWWTANPEGAHLPARAARSASGERGGAHGSW